MLVALLMPFIAHAAVAQNAVRPSDVRLKFDFGGAESLIGALKRGELTDADVDSLLRVRGVRAMADNVTRFFPDVPVAQFRKEVKDFARTQRPTSGNRLYQFDEVWDRREQTLALVRRLRARETLVQDAMAQLAPYRPATGPLEITAYFVAGGVSDGFVFDDNARPEFYINLTRSNGDVNALADNIAHEAYHVMQKAAQRRVPGLGAYADSSESLPPPMRLLTVTLAEGTAAYAVDPKRWASKRAAAAFALFDRVLADLRAQRLTWNEAYQKGFTGTDPRFYFVGHEMARAIDRHCGPGCIARLFAQPPVEFFRQYISLYRRHADISARFSAETEAFLLSQP